MTYKYYKNEIYNILTDDGFKDFKGLQVSKANSVYKLTTKRGHLFVTPDHELFFSKTESKPTKDFNVGDLLYSNFGMVEILGLELFACDMYVYDIIHVDNDLHNFAVGHDQIVARNCVYIDEMAFIDNDVEFYNSTYPVLTSGKKTKLIITSTPNGMNLFYKIYTDSVNGQNNYVNYKVHWKEKPGRDDAWAEEQIRNTSVSKFDVEFNCEFAGSDGTLINGKKLSSLTYEDPITTYDEERLKIYEEPIEDHSYVLIADTSEGIGEDYSFINIIDVTELPYRQVFTYSSNTIVPNMFASIIGRSGKKYNNALALVESNNSSGGIVLEILYNDIEYENLMMSMVKDSQVVASWGGKRSTPGVRTTKTTKSIGCSYLKDMIESDQLIVRDWQTFTELSTFIRKGKSYEAKKGSHDDAVMTLVMFSWLTSQPYFEDLTGINSGKSLRDALSSKSDSNDFSKVFGSAVYAGEQEDDLDGLGTHQVYSFR